MTLDQVIKLPYGENYKLHEKKLKENFSQPPIIFKSELNGMFNIVYENAVFDNFGKAHYEFQYIENKLASTQISIYFYKEKFNHIKEIKELFEERLVKNYKVFLSQYKDGDINQAMQEINACREMGKDNNLIELGRISAKCF